MMKVKWWVAIDPRGTECEGEKSEPDPNLTFSLTLTLIQPSI